MEKFPTNTIESIKATGEANEEKQIDISNVDAGELNDLVERLSKAGEDLAAEVEKGK